MNNCPKCGMQVNQGESFCRECGTKIPYVSNNIQNQWQNNQINNQNQVNSNPMIPNYDQMNNMNQQIINNDDLLIDSYIGKNANSLKYGSFSGWTFFFGPLYALYRKMYLLGFAWIIINIIVSIFLSSIRSLFSFASCIIMSLQFKKLYLNHVKEEVEQIKTENPGRPKEQLMILCSQKGGTNIIPGIIITIIYFIVFIFAISIIIETINKSRNDVRQGYNTNFDTVEDSLSRIIDKLNITKLSKKVSNSNSNYYLKRTDYEV